MGVRIGGFHGGLTLGPWERIVCAECKRRTRVYSLTRVRKSFARTIRVFLMQKAVAVRPSNCCFVQMQPRYKWPLGDLSSRFSVGVSVVRTAISSAQMQEWAVGPNLDQDGQVKRPTYPALPSLPVPF